MTTRLHHVVLVVADLGRSAKFYESVLGLRRGFTMHVSGPGLEQSLRVSSGTHADSIFLSGPRPSTLVELIRLEGHRLAGKGGAGLAIGLQILSFEILEGDLSEVARRAAPFGDCVLSPPRESEVEGYGRIETLMLRDPDDNLVEVVRHPRPGGSESGSPLA